MTSNIHVIAPNQVDPVEEGGGLLMTRYLANRASGSDRVEFEHGVITKPCEFKGIVYKTADELCYVIQGKAELTCNGRTQSVGPGSFFFVPQDTPHDFKLIEAPFEAAVAAFSPERGLP